MNTPRLFHPRNITVAAIQWTGDNGSELVAFAGASDFEVLLHPCEDDGDATASLRESRHSSWRLVHTGDWIVKGVTGNLFLVPEKDFQTDYEPVPPTVIDVWDELDRIPDKDLQAGYGPAPTQGEPLADQVDRLATFIMTEIPGEPIRSEGAIDCAIRLLRTAYA